MKIPETFISEKNLDNKVKDLLSEKQSDDRDGLAIAVGVREHGTVKESRIYAWAPPMKEPKLVRKRDALTFDLCYADNMLYDCGVYKAIYCTLYDKQALVRTQFTPFSMLENNGLLIFSQLGDIYYTSLRKSSCEKKVTSRSGWVYALEHHKNEFYDAGAYGIIESEECYTSSYRITDATMKTKALCSYEGSLYSAGCYTVKNRTAPKILTDITVHAIRNVSTKEEVTRRDSELYTLCSYKNLLLDGGENGKVKNSFTDNIMFDFGPGMSVRALEPIPSAMVKALIETAQ